MTEEFLGLVILLIIWGTPFSGAQVCDYQSKTNTYVCEKVIYQFPNMYYGKFNLKCEDCQIKKFTNDTFPYENLLVSFNISDSGIQNLGPKSFSYFENLEYLFLDHNDIRNIQPETFVNLKKLFELHLEFNSLEIVRPHTFRGMSSSTVNVSYNFITNLTDNTFKYSTGLLSLDISHNNISYLEANSLRGLEDLEVLNLNGNNICYLPLGLFKWTKALQHLNLANNKLQTLEYGSFSGLRSLKYLSLAQNIFNIFESGPLLSTRALITLDISGNGLSMFSPSELYTDVPSLKVLYFEDNIFTCEQLKDVIRFLREKSIQTENNILRLEMLNIDGIACVNGIPFGLFGRKDIPLDTFLRNSSNQAKNLRNCN
ncbi:insulin-like growth factor-binding protein complex acid labile subunit [Anthonomus grandis grandis]|uniref:insulin-like growth factor-binding protein complex acid labile subunit n=1 Tax=Anthonomus grandis grandis TaxID=2921223 RepID=UPI00216564DD|nr:insulin-like growth factor-binding protein complex acid labile subunit [Anthonomus grandis grandis]